jgi:hypothetical protein
MSLGLHLAEDPSDTESHTKKDTAESDILLAVWRIAGDETCTLPLPAYQGRQLDIQAAFPAGDARCHTSWDPQSGDLTVTMPEKGMARILTIQVR